MRVLRSILPMPPDTLVRRAIHSDTAALVPLIEEHALFERGTAEVSVPFLADALASGTLIGWIAQSPVMPVGYATATVDLSTWRSCELLHLDCLFVTTKCRNAGVGKLLIEAAIQHAVACGIDELQWQTPAWNDAACRFYTRLGAVAAPKVRFGLRVPNGNGGPPI